MNEPRFSEERKKMRERERQRGASPPGRTTDLVDMVVPLSPFPGTL